VIFVEQVKLPGKPGSKRANHEELKKSEKGDAKENTDIMRQKRSHAM
jgi:hypothetical protein